MLHYLALKIGAQFVSLYTYILPFAFYAQWHLIVDHFNNYNANSNLIATGICNYTGLFF